MIIGFVGDVHGLVFHCLALLATWQRESGRRLDAVVQLGDMGAYPNTNRTDAASRSYLALDPAQADFSRLLKADGALAEHLHRMREQFVGPIYFLRGNHEDFDYLRRLPLDNASGTARVDDFDLYRYVPDGTVVRLAGLRVAFLGGIETERPDDRTIHEDAYRSLMDQDAGSVDVLATHDPPYGIGVGHRGQISGSRLVTALIERVQPAFHLSAHVHHLNGQRSYGRTRSWSLDCLIASAKWRPEENGFRQGCLAVLDTTTSTLVPVTGSWLSEFDTKGFDFDSWYETFNSGH